MMSHHIFTVLLHVIALNKGMVRYIYIYIYIYTCMFFVILFTYPSKFDVQLCNGITSTPYSVLLNVCYHLRNTYWWQWVGQSYRET